MTGNWLAIDGGQSASRVRTSWREGVFVGSGFVHGPGRVAAMVDALDPALRELGELPVIDVVAAGHTGLPVLEEERRELARLIAARTGAARVVLAADWVTAHAGALAGGPGVVVAAGTGAVALGVDAEGRSRRIDGDGYLFGDAGGGWAIGRAGLELALRDSDGRASAPGVASAARARFGDDLHAAAWGLYAEPSVVDVVARFAPDLIALAGDGDPEAQRLIARAADDLALSAAAAARDLPSPVAVAVAGRLLDPAAELGRRFAQSLDALIPAAVLRPPAGGSLDGAVTFAASGVGIHAALVHTYQERQ